MIPLERRAAALALGAAALLATAHAQDGEDGADAAATGAADPAAGPIGFVTGRDFGQFSGEDLDQGGMLIQASREALAAAGRELEVRYDEWTVGYDGAAAGTEDAAFPWYYVPERDEVFVYGDSVYEVVERLFHRVDDEAVPDVRGADDLAGLVLCYPVGWSLPPSIDAAVEAGEVERVSPGDMARCFALLAAGGANVVLAPELQAYEAIEANAELDTFDVATASWEVTIRVLSPLLSKARGGTRACRAAVDFGAGLATIRANGLFDAIARRWFGPIAQLAEPDERYTVVRRTASGDETLSGRAVGLSGDGFVLVVDGDPVRVPRGELAWIGREGFEEFDASRDWCLDRDAVAAADGAAEATRVASAAGADGEGSGAGGADAEPAAEAEPATEAEPTAEAEPAAGPDGAATPRTLVAAGDPTLLDGLVPALAGGWLERELVPADEASTDGAAELLEVRSPSNDARLPERVALLSGDPASAFAALADGTAELVLSRRPPTAAEAAALAPLGTFPSPETEHVVAIEAIAPIVNAGRALGTIELADLGDALRGTLADWAALDPDAPGALTVHLTESFADSLDDPAGAMLPAPGPEVVRHATRDEVLAAVAADPDALGLVRHPPDGAGYAAAGVRPVAVLDCGLVHAPDAFSVRTEEYPLARRLAMYYSPERVPGFAGALVRHAGSDEGQEAFAAEGFTDLSIASGTRAQVEEAAENLAREGVQDAAVGRELVAATDDRRRVTSTFRFLTGSARLDARAVRDAERLAEWLRARDADADGLALVGYADSVGGYRRNCELSRLRARRVAEALAAEGIAGAPDIVGACEEAPVACNATVEGRELNRRVEVWRRAGTP